MLLVGKWEREGGREGIYSCGDGIGIGGESKYERGKGG